MVLRGTGPRNYGEGGAFFFVARGPVPRERWITRAMARDRPAHYGKMAGKRDEGTGPCTTDIGADLGKIPFPFSSGIFFCEGQARALR